MRLTDLRGELTRLGVRPSKGLGQNFLHDANVARSIVEFLEPKPGDYVVEIGPGLGALTEWLVASGVVVLAIEHDHRLAGWLAERLHDQSQATVCHADAVAFDTRWLLPKGPVKVIGNLPYAVSSPLLFRWTDPPLEPERLVLALQTEVAERICSEADTAAYGVLSIMIQSRYEARILRRLPPQLFFPEPLVESAVIELRPRTLHEIGPVNRATLRRLVTAAFQARRKKVANTLRRIGVIWEECAEQVGASVMARPEDLTVDQWIHLAQLVDGEPGKAQDEEGERFDVVDDQDQVLRPASRREVHEQGLRHRAVHIFVCNAKGELWLQKRSEWKDRHPGLWDSSAAGHLDAGETYAQAAQRELNEEMGVETALRRIGRLEASLQTGMEFVELFAGVHEGPFFLPPSEIAYGVFCPPRLINEWVEQRPGDFAPGFLACWEVWNRLEQSQCDRFFA